jgi:hypothetical protein
MKDGVLFTKCNSILNTREDALLLIVPNVLQKVILVSTHDSVTGAQLGITKTLSAMKCSIGIN